MFYGFQCDGCDRPFELRLDGSTGNLLSRPCPTCGRKARRVFTPIHHRFTFKAGFDPLIGAGFDSQRQRDTYLDAKGLVLREPRA